MKLITNKPLETIGGLLIIFSIICWVSIMYPYSIAAGALFVEIVKKNIIKVIIDVIIFVIGITLLTIGDKK